MQDVRAAVHLLPLRIHAIQEPARVFLEHIPDAGSLDDVDAHFRAHARSGTVRRVLSRGRGVARSRTLPILGPCVASALISDGAPGHPRIARNPRSPVPPAAPYRSRARSFDGHGFGEVTRLVHVVSSSVGYVVREELKRYDRENWR